jgi:hypothetical protein
MAGERLVAMSSDVWVIFQAWARQMLEQGDEDVDTPLAKVVVAWRMAGPESGFEYGTGRRAHLTAEDVEKGLVELGYPVATIVINDEKLGKIERKMVLGWSVKKVRAW